MSNSFSTDYITSTGNCAQVFFNAAQLRAFIGAAGFINTMQSCRTILRRHGLDDGVRSASLLFWALQRAQVEEAARECFRMWAAGGHSLAVALAADASKVGYRVILDQNYKTFRGEFKGYPAREDHHRICVPQDWSVRVNNRGLACLEGLLTLDAHPLHSPTGVELFQAVWVSQGRGFEVNVHRGVIARSQGQTYHADDAEAALRGVARKVKAAGLAGVKRADKAHAAGLQAFGARCLRSKRAWVHPADIGRSGACAYGVQAWSRATGVDFAGQAVPLQKVLEAYAKRPQEEIRRVVLQALRRHRAAQRKRVAG